MENKECVSACEWAMRCCGAAGEGQDRVFRHFSVDVIIREGITKTTFIN